MRSIGLANLVPGGIRLSAHACFTAERCVIHDGPRYERLLANMLDSVPAFHEYIGAALPKEVQFGELLFPHCLGSLGWNHICDGLIQTGLHSLRWIPLWLDLLKSLNRVLRDPQRTFHRGSGTQWTGKCCDSVSLLLLLGSSSCRSGRLVATVIVQSLVNANMLIVGRKGGCSNWPTITR